MPPPEMQSAASGAGSRCILAMRSFSSPLSNPASGRSALYSAARMSSKAAGFSSATGFIVNSSAKGWTGDGR